MERILYLLSPALLVLPAHGEVQVFVEDIAGQAVIKYQCTAGEIVRAFALAARGGERWKIGVGPTQPFA